MRTLKSSLHMFATARPAMWIGVPLSVAVGLVLYVTTARYNRSDAELKVYPQSGCVFSMQVHVPGLPVNFFLD